MKKIFKLFFTICIPLFVFTNLGISQEEQRIIKEIQIKGNKGISTATVMSKIKSKTEEQYFQNIVSDDLKRLYDTGFFTDINVNIEDVEGGIRLIFEVVERSIVEKILFKGNKSISEKRLSTDFKTKSGQYLDYRVLQEDLDAIKKLYERRGFSKAAIDYKEDINKDTNKTTVTINIKEHRRIRVRIFLVEGNYSFPDARIKKLVKTKPKGFLKSGFFDETVFDEDVERIKAFYNKEGFTDCKVTPEVEFGVYDSVYITVKLEEGMRYYCGDITLSGNKEIDTYDLTRRIENLRSAEVFNDDKLKKDTESLQSYYFDKGYIFAQVKGDTFVDPETENVNVVFNIIENKQAYINLIKINGNLKTKDKVIRRELRLKPGDKFDGKKFNRSKERLDNLGFFEKINYDFQKTDKEDEIDLDVEVKESKTGEFSFGGGYSSINQLVGFVEVAQKNFDWKNWPYFTGAGQDLRLRAEIGTISDEFVLSFTEPWIFDKPVSFGFDGYVTGHSREEDVGYAYDEERVGGDLRLGREFNEYLKGSLSYRVESIDITNIVDTATADLKKEEGDNIISSILLGLNFDSRDNVFSPSRGDILGGSIEVAGGPCGGDKDFTKLITSYSHFFPFIRKSTLETRFLAGIANAYSNTEDVPIFERFYAGGSNTIRGYQERKIGPIDPITEDPIGGSSIFVGNIEYLFPLVDIVKLAAFYDFGNVWPKPSDLLSGGDFKAGVGLGLRVKTPLGPIKLDYGIPLDLEPGEEDKQGRFHFSVGSSF